MNTSHLAPQANSGGALPARSSARRKTLGIFSRFPTGALGIQLRRLFLIGFFLLPASQGLASSSTVTLAWDATADPDIAGYELRYGESSGNYTSTVQVGNTTTTSVSGLTEGKTYYFAVYAYNTAGLKSAPSNEAMHSVGVDIIASDIVKVQYVSSEQADVHPAWHAIDGDPNTFWHSEWKTSAPPPPHELQLDLGSVQNLRGFRYLSRQDSVFSGTIAQYEFYVSGDGINWGNPVASGFFQKTRAVQEVLCAATSGRYVRLRALSEADGQPYTNVAELTFLLETSSATNTAPSFTKSSFTFPSGAEQAPYTGQTLAGTATDPDKDDTPTYSKINGPNWLLISKTGELSGTPPLGSKGLNKFTIRATDQAGASSRVSLQIQIEQNSLPLPWTADTIGVASMEAEAEYSAGNYTLAGAGTLTSTEDTGTFGYQTLIADGEIIAQVTELDDTGAAAHVGLTIRGSLAPNSRLVSIGVNGAAVTKQLTRTKTGGKTTKISGKTSSSASYAAGPPPQSAAKSTKSRKIWLRLVRKGDTITSFTSSNGKKWEKFSAAKVKLRKNCYIGLSVSSGKNKRLNTATFSNVKVRR